MSGAQRTALENLNGTRAVPLQFQVPASSNPVKRRIRAITRARQAANHRVNARM
jgi:hypothetical protein